MTTNDNEIVVYEPDETIRLDVRLDDDTVWLTQNQMTDLFQRDRTVITRHINNVFSEGELDEKSNVHFLHIPFSDKPVKNLEGWTLLYMLDFLNTEICSAIDNRAPDSV